jgi:hypothetical protein
MKKPRVEPQKARAEVQPPAAEEDEALSPPPRRRLHKQRSPGQTKKRAEKGQGELSQHSAGSDY